MPILKIQYTDGQSRANIISSNANLFLIEEQNISEGNFLIFSDTLPEPPIIYVTVPQQEFEGIKQQTFQQQEEAKAQKVQIEQLTDELLSLSDYVTGGI